MSPPSRRHGQICNRVGRILGNFAEEHDLGHVLNNDSGIITERDPDSMRGPDVAFYSYKLIPKGPVPDDYGPEIPELVVEVRWKNDRVNTYRPASLQCSFWTTTRTKRSSASPTRLPKP
jgi:Uma2 family endonuclease